MADLDNFDPNAGLIAIVDGLTEITPAEREPFDSALQVGDFLKASRLMTRLRKVHKARVKLQAALAEVEAAEQRLNDLTAEAIVISDSE